MYYCIVSKRKNNSIIVWLNIYQMIFQRVGINLGVEREVYSFLVKVWYLESSF